MFREFDPDYPMELPFTSLPHGRGSWRLVGGWVLHNVHNISDCFRPERCIIHNPSDHPMRRMLQEPYDGYIQRCCDHLEWHPDPDGLSEKPCNCGCHCCEFPQKQLRIP